MVPLLRLPPGMLAGEAPSPGRARHVRPSMALLPGGSPALQWGQEARCLLRLVPVRAWVHG